MEELIIGSHVSFKKDTQLLGSLEEALSYGENTFMFYTGAPQNTSRAEINMELVTKAFQKMKEHNMNPVNVIVHAPYIINLANNEKKDNYQFAISFLKQEIKRCESLGMTKLVLHPGSSVKLEHDVAVQNIIHGLNEVLREDQTVTVLLETMALKGTEIGSLDDLKAIVEGVTLSDKLGVCIDTCHLNDAGYDMTKFDEFLLEFDQKIGLSKIGCVHVNDSKNVMGAHKDRHENMGFGTLGFETLINIIYHDKLKDVPKILETPYVTLTDDAKERVYPPYKFEIEMIRKKEFDPELITKIRKYYK